MKKIQLNSSQFPNSVYHKSGSGYPIILLHGFGEDSRIWKNQVASLEQNYTCICPDIAGSGCSELQNPSISLDDLADFIQEILVKEQIEKTILLGHSMGGYIALAFVERFSTFLDGFGLIHSSAFADDETKKDTRRKAIRLIEQEGKVPFLKAMIPNLYSEASKVRIQEEINFHLTMALETSSISLIAYYNAMIARPDRTNCLKETTMPVLFVFGTDDNAIPIAQGLSQTAMPSFSQVEILEHVGHTSMLEASEKLNSILNSFCKCTLNYKNV
jgi:pimeloyl-ACP methyl ester carboxylesterase